MGLTVHPLMVLHVVSERGITHMQKPGSSRVEKLLDFEFTSDPRQSKYPLPELPAGWPSDKPHPFPPIKITPHMARDWVQHRLIVPDVTPRDLKHDDYRANRNIVLGKLFGNQYKPGLIEVIRSGGWNPRISQGAGFTSDGFISDAQHRFIAIAAAGVEVEMIITRNAGWDAFDVTDDVRTRSAGQFLGENGELKSSIARHLFPIILGTQGKEYSSRVPSISDVRELVEAWPWFHTTESLDSGSDVSWLSKIKQVNREIKVPKAQLGAVVMAALAAGANPFDVEEFLEGLKISSKVTFVTIGTDGEDPRYLVRKRFHNANSRIGRQHDSIQYGNMGFLRTAMTIWLERNSDSPIKVSKIDPTPMSRKLPPFWNTDAVREFHAKQFN